MTHIEDKYALSSRCQPAGQSTLNIFCYLCASHVQRLRREGRYWAQRRPPELAKNSGDREFFSAAVYLGPDSGSFR